MSEAGQPSNPIGFLTESADHLTLRIRSCWEQTCGCGWSESKAHADYDLWLIREGRVDIRFDDVSFTAGTGDVVFFYPHVPYTARAREEGCQFVFVHFDFGLGNQLRILDGLPLAGIVPGLAVREEFALFCRTFRERRETSRKTAGGLAALKLKGALTLLAAKIVELYESNAYTGQFPRQPAGQNRSRGLTALKPVFEFMHSHIHLPLKTRELAAVAGLSEKYFIMYFKSMLGITPSQYLHQLKMNQARDYLYQRRYSVKEIASLLGFPDPYSFSKAFKAYFHVSPSQFV